MRTNPLGAGVDIGGTDRTVAADALHRGARRLAALLRIWRGRSRERSALARFDERMLKDIGLSRADAEFLINKPFWRE
jgi:uncharacterized protein YjiS (DUF1127 family)